MGWISSQNNKSSMRYLDYLVDSSFQRLDRFFVLSFEDDNGQKSHKQYYLPTVNINDYNVKIDERIFFWLAN